MKRGASKRCPPYFVLESNAIAYESTDDKAIRDKKAKLLIPLKLKTSPNGLVPQIQISGQVLDENSQPLPGANIVEKGTTNGTQTDFDGQFSIYIDSRDAILSVSYIGYVTTEVNVSNESDISNIIVIMSLDSAIEEVVVVGYGTARRRDLTGSIVSVSAEDVQKTPSNNFLHSIQGRAAGVDIKASNNEPGGGIRIRIRGTSSINSGSQPLYVVDGFPLPEDLNTANPLLSLSDSEIESITILKDASATAIYGARGANGVVIITTRRGAPGRAKLDLGYSTQISTVRNKLDLANAEEIAILTNEWAANNNRLPIYDGVKKPLPEELGEGTDWQDEIFRTALTHRVNLSVSGGNEKSTYLISGDYLDQDGIIIESNFKRAGVKVNFNQQFGNRLSLGLNVNANRSISNRVPTDGTGFTADTPLWNAQTATPVIPVRDANGNFVHNHDESVKVLENPVSIATTRTDVGRVTRILSTAYVQYDIIEGLNFKAHFGLDLLHSKRQLYAPTTVETQTINHNGQATILGGDNTNILNDYSLNYNKSWGIHRLDLTLLHSIQTNKRESFSAQTQDFINDILEFNNLGSGSNPRPSGSFVSENGLLSYLGRVRYNFMTNTVLLGLCEEMVLPDLGLITNGVGFLL